MKTKKKYGGVGTRSQTRSQTREKIAQAEVAAVELPPAELPEDLLKEKRRISSQKATLTKKLREKYYFLEEIKPSLVMKFFEQQFQKDISIILLIQFYKTVMYDFLNKKSSLKISSKSSLHVDSKQLMGIFQCIFSKTSPLFKLIESLNKFKYLLNFEQRYAGDLFREEGELLQEYYQVLRSFIRLNLKYAKLLQKQLIDFFIIIFFNVPFNIEETFLSEEFLFIFINSNEDILVFYDDTYLPDGRRIQISMDFFELLLLDLDNLIKKWSSYNDPKRNNLEISNLIENFIKELSTKETLKKNIVILIMDYINNYLLKVEGFTKNNVLEIIDKIFLLYHNVNIIFKRYKEEYDELYSGSRGILTKVQRNFPAL